MSSNNDFTPLAMLFKIVSLIRQIPQIARLQFPSYQTALIYLVIPHRPIFHFLPSTLLSITLFAPQTQYMYLLCFWTSPKRSTNPSFKGFDSHSPECIFVDMAPVRASRFESCHRCLQAKAQIRGLGIGSSKNTQQTGTTRALVGKQPLHVGLYCFYLGRR